VTQTGGVLGYPQIQEIWPPKDPETYGHSVGPRLSGKSPFTYGNGFNPSLQPSNGQLRSRLHPTTEEEDRMTSSTPSRESFSSNEYLLNDDRNHEVDELGVPNGNVRVRRGSEGWEVRPTNMDREEIVQRYLASRGLEEDSPRPIIDPTQKPGRYRLYVPEAHDESDESDEEILQYE